MIASRVTTTALLVDDQPTSLSANQRRLESEGYSVVSAQNVTDALSQARRSVPKVIFVHLMATGLGSLSLIQALRSDDGCRHIPVVLITDHADRRLGKKLHSVPREG